MKLKKIVRLFFILVFLLSFYPTFTKAQEIIFTSDKYSLFTTNVYNDKSVNEGTFNIPHRIQVIDQSAEGIVDKKTIFTIRGGVNFYMVCTKPPTTHMEGATEVITFLCKIEFMGNKYDGQFAFHDRKKVNNTFVLSYMVGGNIKVDYIFQSIVKQ